MRRAAVFIATGLALVWSGWVWSAPLQAGNVVGNPGFEQADGRLPAVWLAQNLGNGEIALDATVHAGGSRSLRLTPNGRNVRPDQPLGVGQQIRLSGLGGRRLAFHAAIRTGGGAAASLLIFAVAANGRFVGSANLRQSEPTPGFITKGGTLTLDSATDSIIVACSVSGTSGYAWFDDVSAGLEEVDAAPAGNRADNPQAVPVASIAIDAGQVIRAIPRTLYGANIEWIYDGHGVWDRASARLQPGLVRQAREMGVGLVRFPGGVLADYYHWKDGIGPLRDRPEIPFVVAPGRRSNSFGTDELISFCRSIGAEPLLQANLVTGTANEAADWVTFTNNKGRPEGYRVRYWDLGNEQYMKHPNPETARSYMTVRDYVSKVQEFAVAMKRRDPGIHLGAVGGTNFGNYKIVEDENWNRTVLAKTASLVDFISIHDGYAPVVMEQKDVSFEDVYRALLAFPVLLAENLKKVNRDIEQYAPRDAARLRIGITEWGPLFAFGPTSPWVGHTKTLGSALFAASVLQTLFRADRVDLAAFFQLISQNNFSGWIDEAGSPKATAFALEMFTRHFGESLVRSSVESPSFATRAVGVVAPVAAVPYIDATASLSADGSRLFVMVVNKHFASKIRTSVHVEGFTTRSGRSWVLTAGSLDANNGNDLPNLPGVKWAAPAHAPHGSMFDAGAADTVSIRPGAEVANAAKDFQFEFPPMSVTSIELTRR
ncbi:MAG: hypothetical protein ABJC09_04365 [Terriglobia bacterium]